MGYETGAAFATPDLTALPRVASVMTQVHERTNRAASKLGEPDLGTTVADEGYLLSLLVFASRDLARETRRFVRLHEVAFDAEQQSNELPPWLGTVAEAYAKDGSGGQPTALTQLSEARALGRIVDEEGPPSAFWLSGATDAALKMHLHPVPGAALTVLVVAGAHTALEDDEGALGGGEDDLSVIYPPALVEAMVYAVLARWWETCGQSTLEAEARARYAEQLRIHRFSPMLPASARVKYRGFG